MHLASLEAFGFDRKLIESLHHRYGPELLDLQARAVCEHELFKGRSILVVGPSSSGKTLIGELAAIRAAWQRRRALYLVPTRALAEEKYQQMAQMLEPLGLRVCISTRERRGWDLAIVQGEFDLCVMVFEKLWGLLIHRPRFLRDVSTVVVDELQVLGDRERGAKLDLLLTHLLTLDPRPQIVGLSASLADADRVASWLGASILRGDLRPVELRRGVAYGGRFHYREHNSGQVGEEALMQSPLPPGEEDVGAEMLATAEALARRGERSIVFLRDKRTCIGFAHRLAERLPAHSAREALEELGRIEESAGAPVLERLLRSGVAIHHADLPGELRDLVERACRRGEIAVLCATSTLAQGMNLPLDNVLVDVKKWDDAARWGEPGGCGSSVGMTEILPSEFENMAGRAGRLGLAHAKAPGFGRAILFAESPFACDVLARIYVDGGPEPLHPPLRPDSLAEGIGHLLAARLVDSEQGVAQFLRRTFSGTHGGFQAEDIGAGTAALRKSTILVQRPDCVEMANGAAAGLAQGASLATVGHLLRWADGIDGDSYSDADLLLALAETPDGQRLHVLLTLAELEGRTWSSAMTSRGADGAEAAWGADGGTLRQAQGVVSLSNHSRGSELAAKKALLLCDWIGWEATATIEGRYRLLAGAIGNLAAEFSRLARAAQGVLAARRPQMSALAQRLEELADRLSAGGPRECVALSHLGIRGLSRGWLLELARLNLDEPESLVGAGIDRLREVLPAELAEKVFRRAQQWIARKAIRAAAEATPAAPAGAALSPEEGRLSQGSQELLLRLSRRRPNEVWVRDRRIAITRKQFELILALAHRPGQCVRYEELYDALWGEGLAVEPNQIRYHKNLLLRRLRLGGLSSLADGLIRTVHGTGLVLDLSPAAVSVA